MIFQRVDASGDLDHVAERIATMRVTDVAHIKCADQADAELIRRGLEARGIDEDRFFLSWVTVSRR